MSSSLSASRYLYYSLNLILFELYPALFNRHVVTHVEAISHCRKTHSCGCQFVYSLFGALVASSAANRQFINDIRLKLSAARNTRQAIYNILPAQILHAPCVWSRTFSHLYLSCPARHNLHNIFVLALRHTVRLATCARLIYIWRHAFYALAALTLSVVSRTTDVAHISIAAAHRHEPNKLHAL